MNKSTIATYDLPSLKVAVENTRDAFIATLQETAEIIDDDVISARELLLFLADELRKFPIPGEPYEPREDGDHVH